MIPSTLRHILAVILLLTAVGRAQINFTSTINSPDRYSNGSPMDEQMIFELGVFVPGFIPSAANRSQWAANWRRASAVAYNPLTRFFSGVYQVETNVPPFLPATKGYIWGHTGQCTGGEWILMSAPSWAWPTMSPFSLPVFWTSGSATEFYAGGVDRNNPGAPQPVPRMTTESVNAPLPVMLWTEWLHYTFDAAQRADPAVSGPLADPDGDRLVNLTEYALGTHPKIHGATGRISYTLTSDGTQQRLTMTVIKRCDRNVLWSGQASLNLTSWPSGSTTVVSESADAITFREKLSFPEDRRIFLRPAFSLP